MRGPTGFAQMPIIVTGRDKIVRVATQDLILPMAAVYAGVEFD